ncbi:MAG TPA: MBL fold metallo-hydrolase, partial [Candidatus Baltobacteraceae bacterium]|nr:MBL fold metallo-hydrolase [Candidatus Baltobacteraceae bacterium]
IDPGPANAAHLGAIERAAGERRLAIAAIAVTHGHPDHAPGAAPLAARTRAPVYAHRAARFAHDRVLTDDALLEAGDSRLRALEAPGHARDHLVFFWEVESALFTGDVVVGRGTVVVAPPHGDMRAYQATLARLRREFANARRIYGGHGPPVDDPAAKLDEYLAHRIAREEEILGALSGGERTIPELVAHVYRDVSIALWPAAARQVLAHLIALEREGRVRARPLERKPSAEERALLSPDLAKLADRETAALAAAELGLEREVSTLEAYSLVA